MLVRIGVRCSIRDTAPNSSNHVRFGCALIKPPSVRCSALLGPHALATLVLQNLCEVHGQERAQTEKAECKSKQRRAQLDADGRCGKKRNAGGEVEGTPQDVYQRRRKASAMQPRKWRGKAHPLKTRNQMWDEVAEKCSCEEMRGELHGG